MDQLEDNLASVDLALTDEEMTRLDDVSRLPVSYPHWMTSLGDDRLPGQSRDREGVGLKPAGGRRESNR